MLENCKEETKLKERSNQSESLFRKAKVIPFLKTLKNTVAFPIQQVAIVGDPDFILCCHGKFVALELKRDGEVPRPKQQEKLINVSFAKGVSMVTSPSVWEQTKLLLKHIDGGH